MTVFEKNAAQLLGEIGKGLGGHPLVAAALVLDQALHLQQHRLRQRLEQRFLAVEVEVNIA